MGYFDAFRQNDADNDDCWWCKFDIAADGFVFSLHTRCVAFCSWSENATAINLLQNFIASRWWCEQKATNHWRCQRWQNWLAFTHGYICMLFYMVEQWTYWVYVSLLQYYVSAHATLSHGSIICGTGCFRLGNATKSKRGEDCTRVQEKTTTNCGKFGLNFK